MNDVTRDAYVSPCKMYRYLLTRQWNHPNAGLSDTQIHAMGMGRDLKQMVFVMLNPSTADAYEDDPTIRRCVSFARREGYDMLHVANLYAGRATKPSDLYKMGDPVGPENERVWSKIKKHAEDNVAIVCAWGADRRARIQAQRFLNFMDGRALHCLGTTKDGSPKHPLYLKSDAPLVLYS